MAAVLDEEDIRSVLEATTALATEPAPDIETVLELMRSLISCTSASFNDMAPAAGDFRYLIVPPDQEDPRRGSSPSTTGWRQRNTRWSARPRCIP